VDPDNVRDANVTTDFFGLNLVIHRVRPLQIQVAILEET
jgi:hypothetical protein